MEDSEVFKRHALAVLSIGARVELPPDRDLEDGPAPGVGTVIGLSEGGWVQVRWDSGHEAKYRMGAEGTYDLQSAEGSGTVVSGFESETVTSVYIYPPKCPTKSNPTDDDLSVVVTTASGNVYGKGVNSLVRFYEHRYPMAETDQETLTVFSKVEKLSGIGLKKIAVGLGFGVGLSENNVLYIWGDGPRVNIGEAVIRFQSFVPGTIRCSKCSRKVESREAVGHYLAYCTGAGVRRCGYITYDLKELPPSGMHLKYFLNSSLLKKRLRCLSCGNICSSKPVSDYTLSYCIHCNVLQEVETPQKKPLREILVDVEDVDSGLDFFCVLNKAGNLKMWRWEKPNLYQSPISVPPNETISSICCGESYIAAVSQAGSLFVYGLGAGEEMKTKNPQYFKKIETPSRVLKLLGSKNTLLYLLADKSVWLLHDGVKQSFDTVYISSEMKMVSPVAVLGSISTADTDFFYFTNETKSCVFSVQVGDKGELEFGLDRNWFGNLLLKLCSYHQTEILQKGTLDQRIKFPRRLDGDQQEQAPKETSAINDQEELEEAEPVKARPEAKQACSGGYQAALDPEKLPSFLRELYSLKFMSDVSIKLADGEFPGHWLVLSSTSSYFKNLLTKEDAPLGVLDMSSYNPRAYRVLLQHFYQVEHDVLDFEDLLALLSLAVSYQELALVKGVSDQLKAEMQCDNVLRILMKARAAGVGELAQECETFVSTPAYKDWLAAIVLQDPTKVPF